MNGSDTTSEVTLDMALAWLDMAHAEADELLDIVTAVAAGDPVAAERATAVLRKHYLNGPDLEYVLSRR